MAKPEQKPRDVAIGCSLMVFLAVVLVLVVRDCARDAPPPGPEPIAILVRNEGPAIELRLLYRLKRGGEPITNGQVFGPTRFTAGDFQAESIELPTAPGDVLELYGVMRAPGGVWIDVAPVEGPAAGRLHVFVSPAGMSLTAAP